MNHNQKPARTNIYGPYDVSQNIGGEAIDVLTISYGDVLNSQVIVNLEDNLINALVASAQTVNVYCEVLQEVTFWGDIAGYQTLLKREQIRSINGPASFVTDPTDAYDTLVIKSRLFCGGKPGFPSDIVFALPLAMFLTVHVRPRKL